MRSLPRANCDSWERSRADLTGLVGFEDVTEVVIEVARSRQCILELSSMMSMTWPTTFSTLPMASGGKTVFACA